MSVRYHTLKQLDRLIHTEFKLPIISKDMKISLDNGSQIDTVHPVWVPEQYLRHFELLSQEQFRVDIPFTRQGWHGRMRACRGVGASMSGEQLVAWDKEHMEMLEKEASESFIVKHYISIAELQVKKE